jgi:hypothetical protein
LNGYRTVGLALAAILTTACSSSPEPSSGQPELCDRSFSECRTFAASRLPATILWPDTEAIEFASLTIDSTAAGPVLTLNFIDDAAQTISMVVTAAGSARPAEDSQETPKGRRYLAAKDKASLTGALYVSGNWQYRFLPIVGKSMSLAVVTTLIDSLESVGD